MKDSKLNNNRPSLTDEEIKNAENFDGVLDQYNAGGQNFFKKNWHFISSGVILGIIALVVYNKNPESAETDHETSQFEIKAPIIGLDAPFGKYIVNASKPEDIPLESGTMIRIPENAFVDENGNPIKGEVEIEFREFHDVAEIFASGIPMTYDSAGTQYHFESAGMFEIKGFQQGKEIFINPDAPLVVELASKQQGGYFNLYSLGNKGVWNFIEKDTAKGVQVAMEEADSTVVDFQQLQLGVRQKENQKELKKAEKNLDKLLKEHNLVMPSQANDDLYAIELEYKKEEFPELEPFKNILFEITEENENFTPDLADTDWDDIKLKKKNNEYILTLFADADKYKFKVCPVVSSENMNETAIAFDNLFEAYDKKLEGKLSEQKALRDALKKANQAISDSVIWLNNTAAINARNTSEVQKSTSKVKRIFTMDSFGVYNSDCPLNLPKEAIFEPVFVNKKEKKDTLSFDHLFMAELNKNALYSLNGYWGKTKTKGEEEAILDEAQYSSQEISYNPYHKTVVWGVTVDNRLAIVVPEDMSLIKPGTQSDVGMLIVDQKLTHISKLRKLLGFAS